jgi:hypothetical protein
MNASQFVSAIVLKYTLATRTQIVNASVPTNAVKMTIVPVQIKCAQATTPAFLRLRIPRPVNAIAQYHTRATRTTIVNASVHSSAAKMAIALARIKNARATIPASLYLRILLPVNVLVLRHTFAMVTIIAHVAVPMHAAAITIAPMIQFARTMNAWFVNALRHTFAMIIGNVYVPMHAAAITIAPTSQFARTMNAGVVNALRHTFAMIIGMNVSVRTSVAATMTVRMEPWVIVIRTILATMMFLLEGCDDLVCHNECILNQR